MTQYLLAFRGGMPKTPEEGQKMMADWNTWMGDLGKALVDSGAGLGKSRFLVAPGKEGSIDGALSGYSVIEASDYDAALAMASKCPIFSAGGTIEVAETMQM
jgi:hypothetical protein